MGYGIDNWMVAWTPTNGVTLSGDMPAGSVRVGPWPDETGWSKNYSCTTGCCELERHKWSGEASEYMKITMIFIDFHTLVVGDGIDPQSAHREFLKIDEYRRRISPDIDGVGD